MPLKLKFSSKLKAPEIKSHTKLNIKAMMHEKLGKFMKAGKFKAEKAKFMKLKVPKLKG